MKKSTIGLACVCMFLLAASCQIPNSVTIKGSPGGRLSLGSPFNFMDERLEDYFTDSKIKEMMGGTGNNVRIFDYTGSDNPNIQTYVVLYPITEMELDLQDYIDNITEDDTSFTHNIPSLAAGNFPYYLTRTGPKPGTTPLADVEPLFTIELPDMAKLVQEISGGSFGLELNYKDDFRDNLQVKIPTLGINDYIQGKVSADGKKLQFVNDGPGSPKIHPQADFKDGKIGIYVKATGPCSGIIAPDMVFDWINATIDTSGNPINDQFPINNKDLEGFLGGGIKFNDAKGYIYIGGLDEDKTDPAYIPPSMTLKKAGTLPNNNIASGNLEDRPHPSFADPVEDIPQHSLANQPFIDLTDVLNESTSNAINLEYNVVINNMVVTKASLDAGEKKKIFADLVILLPMEFKVTTASSYGNDYARLQLKGLPEELGNDGKDLFQREPGEENNMFEMLNMVKITLSKTRNDILGGDIYILISPSKAGPFKIADGEFVEFDPVSLQQIPFVPRFEILVKKNTAGDALFGLKRKTSDNATFDFSLTIEAKVDINQTISF